MRIDEIPLLVSQFGKSHYYPLQVVISKLGLNSFEISSKIIKSNCGSALHAPLQSSGVFRIINNIIYYIWPRSHKDPDTRLKVNGDKGVFEGI